MKLTYEGARWRAFGYWLVGLLACIAGVAYGWPPLDRSAGLFRLAALIPVLFVMYVAVLRHVNVYVLPSENPSILQGSESIAVGRVRREWFADRKDYTRVDDYAGFLELLLGVSVLGNLAARLTGSWPFCALIVLGYFLPLGAYVLTIVWLRRRATVSPHTSDSRIAIEDILRVRNQLATPTLLYVYVPFLLSLALLVYPAHFAGLAALLVAVIVSYGILASLVKSHRGFVWVGIGGYVLLILGWVVAVVARSAEARYVVGVHIFAITLAIYMAAFEFLGVLRYKVRENSIRRAFGLSAVSKAEATKKNEDYYYWSTLGLIVFFVIFPFTYLGDTFGLGYLVAAGFIGVVSGFLWTSFSPIGYLSQSEILKRHGWVQKMAANLKVMAYLIPLVVVAGRIPLHTQVTEPWVLATIAGTLLAGFAFALRDEISFEGVREPRGLLIVGSLACLFLAVAILLLSTVQASALGLSAESLRKLGLIGATYAAIGFAALTISMVIPHYASRQRKPRENAKDVSPKADAS